MHTYNNFDGRPESSAWMAWHILHNTYVAMSVGDGVAAANVNGVAVTITHSPGIGLQVFAIDGNNDAYGYDPQGNDAQAIATDAIGFITRHAYPDTIADESETFAESIHAHRHDVISADDPMAPYDPDAYLPR